MTSSPQSPCTFSLLERCASEILERIAFYTVAGTFLGPPTNLISLLCTSKTLHHALASENNSSLYARIFEVKFDLAAPRRRLTERWFTLKCLSCELRTRFVTLRRIRSRAMNCGPEVVQDLWTCFLMLLECDEKNMAQLVEWARIIDYIQLLTRNWLQGSVPYNFSRSSGALAFSVLSGTVREDDLTSQWCGELTRLAGYYIVSGCQYPSSYAPGEFFHLPLCTHSGSEMQASLRDSSRLVELYSHKLPVVAPLLTSSAMMVFSLATDQIKPRFSGTRDPKCSPSERCDDDWSRLVSCYDPFSVGSALRGKLYTPGNLSGHWHGRVLIPSPASYHAMLIGNMAPAAVPVKDMRVSFDLQEHHCFTDPPLATGNDESVARDDVFNAWIPRGVVVEHTADSCSIYDPVTEALVIYETYKPKEDPHYSASTNRQEQHSWVSDTINSSSSDDHVDTIVEPGASDSSPREKESNPTYIDDDCEWEDTVEHLTSGITDIIVTGVYVETYQGTSRTSNIVGRVRSWDGLIVLRRLPQGTVIDERSCSWIFKGYIHKMDWLIGRWQENLAPIGRLGWEGGFMVEKQEH